MFLASGVGSVTAKGLVPLAEKIAAVCRQYDAGRIVMGCPFNMDGTEGKRADKTRRFASILEDTCGLPVELVDERLTTVQAHEYMNETNTRGRKRKSAVDALSAEIILQEWLDAERKKAD